MVLKSRTEIQRMDDANRIVHRVLDGIAERVGLGVTTGELDRWAEATIREAGGVPAFLGYRGFPATLCASVNEVVVHGIPDDRPLCDGDVLSVDCGVHYRGYCGDAARTYAVGRIDAEAERLLAVTREALDRAVERARTGNRLSDLGAAVQSWVEEAGFNVVRDFTGHGIGTALHEDPEIPNYGPPGRGPWLRPGMVLALEPMVNVGTAEVEIDEDGWTARTADGSRSAHFEFSVAVTEDEPRILGVNEVNEDGAAHLRVTAA
jgi:methionyl aminopeptidase